MTAPPTLLVATWNDGLYLVRAGLVEREIAESPVVGLAHGGAGGALAIVAGHSLRRRSTDGRWTTLATSDVVLAACTTLGDEVFVGTDDARVMRLTEDGHLAPIPGFDACEGRETWYAGTAIVDGRVVGPPLGVRSMCATSDRSTLLVNVHVGGVPRSTDGGAMWRPTIDVACDVHEVCAHPERSNVVAAATGVGLAMSHDGGATWTIEHDGLHAQHCLAVAFVSDETWVAASSSPFASEGAVYRRPIDRPGELTRVSGGRAGWLEGSVDTGGITAHGDLVAVADKRGDVYLSSDRARSWEKIAIERAYPTGVILC